MSERPLRMTNANDGNPMFVVPSKVHALTFVALSGSPTLQRATNIVFDGGWSVQVAAPIDDVAQMLWPEDQA